jgi:hypothetical protein
MGQRIKPMFSYCRSTARLKPCPDTNRRGPAGSAVRLPVPWVRIPAFGFRILASNFWLLERGRSLRFAGQPRRLSLRGACSRLLRLRRRRRACWGRTGGCDAIRNETSATISGGDSPGDGRSRGAREILRRGELDLPFRAPDSLLPRQKKGSSLVFWQGSLQIVYCRTCCCMSYPGGGTGNGHRTCYGLWCPVFGFRRSRGRFRVSACGAGLTDLEARAP